MVHRNDFGALVDVPAVILKLKHDVSAAGAWVEGIESDRKQRGQSINVDVYSYCERRMLAVVQVRQCTFRPGRFSKIRKDYYLIGYNETGTAFAHAIDTILRKRGWQGSCDGGVDVALAQIWGCDIADLAEIIRQGDVALVPHHGKMPVGEELPDLVLRDTHIVEPLRDGKIIRCGNDFYAVKSVKITHTKAQHATEYLRSGVRKIVAGHRAQTWGFSRPTAD